MVFFNGINSNTAHGLNFSNDQSQAATSAQLFLAQSSRNLDMLRQRPVTRLYAAQLQAMNQPVNPFYLRRSVDSANDDQGDLAPRLSAELQDEPQGEDMDLGGPGSSSDGDSKSLSLSGESDTEISAEETGSDQGSLAAESVDTHTTTDEEMTSADEDFEQDIEAEVESAGLEEAEDPEPGKKKGKVLEFSGLSELVDFLTGNAGRASLNLINDKASFLESIGINFSPIDQTKETNDQRSKADKLWENFRDFNSSQVDLMLGIDQFSISVIKAKIHTDPRLETKDKQQLLGACEKLSSTIKDFKEKDKLFQEIKGSRELRGGSADDMLRMNAGVLARGISTLKDTQAKLQSAGYSLHLDNLDVAMKSGLQVQQNNQNRSTVKFANVVGIDEAKAELQEIVSFLKDPIAFTKLGARIPKGVLLSGPPGTGKTLLAKAVAGEAGVPFFSVSGSAFVEEYVGVGAKRVRDLFQQAKAHDACILFIDEIDAVGGRRNSRGDGSGREHDQTLNALLVEMDGFSARSGVIVMGATNRPDMLDSALKRPGRFDRNIAIPVPNVNGREAILKLHSQTRAFSPNVDFNAIARRTTGYSGADLENLINEAALLAGRAQKARIEQSDLELAHDKLMMGVETPSLRMSEKNRLNTAYHEAGHAIVSYLLQEQEHDVVYKVTILPRGWSLGATHYLPPEDTTSISYRKLRGDLCSLMGGRVAEEILLGEDGVTTGASNDLQRAASMARRMVTEWGFSKVLGPVAFRDEQGQSAKISEKTSEIIDAEVKRLITEAEAFARAALTTNRDKLDAMAQALLKHETIDQKQVSDIMSAPRPQSVSLERKSSHDMLL